MKMIQALSQIHQRLNLYPVAFQMFVTIPFLQFSQFLIIPFSIHHITKKIFSISCTYRDEIGTFPGIIPILHPC